MGEILDSIEAKRAVLLAAKEGAERTRKDARKVWECTGYRSGVDQICHEQLVETNRSTPPFAPASPTPQHTQRRTEHMKNRLC